MCAKARRDKSSRKRQGSRSEVHENRSPSMVDEPVNPFPPYSGEEIQEAVGAGLIHRRLGSQRGSPELSGGDENEPLKLGEKEEQRDSQRWELDPASSEDYQEHVARGKKREHTEQD